MVGLLDCSRLESAARSESVTLSQARGRIARRLPVPCVFRGNDRAILKAGTGDCLVFRQRVSHALFLPTAAERAIEINHRIKFLKPKLCKLELASEEIPLRVQNL